MVDGEFHQFWLIELATAEKLVDEGSKAWIFNATFAQLMKDGSCGQKELVRKEAAVWVVVANWLVRTCRATPATALSKASWVKKTKAVSKIAQSRPRKGIATMANSTITTPLRLRARRPNTPPRRGGATAWLFPDLSIS